MIDWDRIRKLQSEIGEEDFPEVVDLFIAEVAEYIARLKNAPEISTIGSELHALRGSALNLGFATFAELCHTGESQSLEGRADEIDLVPLLMCYEESKLIFLNGLENGEAA